MPQNALRCAFGHDFPSYVGIVGIFNPSGIRASGNGHRSSNLVEGRWSPCCCLILSSIFLSCPSKYSFNAWISIFLFGVFIERDICWLHDSSSYHFYYHSPWCRSNPSLSWEIPSGVARAVDSATVCWPGRSMGQRMRRRPVSVPTWKAASCPLVMHNERLRCTLLNLNQRIWAVQMIESPLANGK